MDTAHRPEAAEEEHPHWDLFSKKTPWVTVEMQPWTMPLCTCCFYSLQSSEEKLETSVLPYKANWGTSLGRRGCDSGKPARGLKEGLCASVVQIFTHTHTGAVLWFRKEDRIPLPLQDTFTNTYKLYRCSLYFVNFFPLNSQNLDSLLQIGVWRVFIPTI